MKLIRVGIRNFCSIGEEYVFIDLRKKLNILIGANNSGKSNIVRAFEFLVQQSNNPKLTSETDKHFRRPDARVGFNFEFETGGDDPVELRKLETVSIDWEYEGNQQRARGSNLHTVGWQLFNDIMHVIERRQFSRVPNEGELKNAAQPVAERLLLMQNHRFGTFAIVPQFRQIIEAADYSLDGRGVVKLLSSWQHPEIGKDNDHQKFRKVEELLRRLLEMQTISLEVSYKQDHIIVANGDLRLPLQSYGTGIHQLIILAIAVLSKESAILGIEEPEIHLHPRLQKRLIEFLRNETSNRYIITTHSPALICPGEEVAITHLWLERGVTHSRPVETTGHSLQILHDLGVEPSDLLQANSIVWVEGPSDRIYLNAWFKHLDSTLREGIDYSIMFYGGRLLSHLCMEREENKLTEDFIKLLRINQHSAIVIDSDRGSAEDGMNETKQRIKDECARNSVHCWITSGREIENYLPTEAIEAAYQEKTEKPLKLKFCNFDRLEECLEKAYGSDWKPSWSYNDAKPAFARLISKHLKAEALQPDLQTEIATLLAVIRHKTNGKLAGNSTPR